MRVATIVGARPQLVKAALSPVLRRQATEILIHTGQHYDFEMSQVFFEQLPLPAPDHHLGVGSGTHGAQTGTMLQRLEPILVETKPDWVLVYGDTNSTLGGALAAAKLALRSYTSKPGCAASCVPCRRRSTAWSPIMCPCYGCARPRPPSPIWRVKGSRRACIRWGT